MTDSILGTTKNSLGLHDDYTVFDQQIIMHINSVFSDLNQIGIGPVEGFEIQDAAATWDSYLLSNSRFSGVKSYMYLRVKMLFDPPTTSFHIAAIKEQIEKWEWRLSVLRESGIWIPGLETPLEIDGGNAVGG